MTTAFNIQNLRQAKSASAFRERSESTEKASKGLAQVTPGLSHHRPDSHDNMPCTLPLSLFCI